MGEFHQKQHQYRKDARSTMKDIISMLPKGRHKKELEQKLKEAEEKVRLAELQIPKIAQKLGYPLYHCTFPPQIMLGIRYRGTERSQESFQCPTCQWIYPPERPMPAQAQTEWDVFTGKPPWLTDKSEACPCPLFRAV